MKTKKKAKKKPIALSLAKCKKINRWRMMPIKSLPEGSPVIAIQEFADKNMASFHLFKYCLIPDFEHTDFKTATK